MQTLAFVISQNSSAALSRNSDLNDDASFADSDESGNFEEESLQFAASSAGFDGVWRVNYVFRRNSDECAPFAADDHPQEHVGQRVLSLREKGIGGLLTLIGTCKEAY